MIGRLIDKLAGRLNRDAAAAINRAQTESLDAWLADQDRELAKAWARVALLRQQLALLRRENPP